MLNKNEILKKIINIYYKISYVLEFALAIPLAIFVLELQYNKAHTGFWFLSDLIPASIFLILVIAIIVTQIIKYRDKLEKMFLSFAIPIGMMYAIYMLPTYVPDENTHLIRAYQISIGNFIEAGQEAAPNVSIPQNIVECMIENIQNYSQMFATYEQGNDNYNDVTERNNLAQSYFPLLYMFSAAGLFIGKLLLLNPFITIYLAKILNFVAYLVLGYFTIKKIPFGKIVALAYLMLPMVLHQATSISADSLTNSVSLFFIAYTLHLVKRKEVMTKKEEILYYVLALFIAIAKIAYMPLVALSWLFIGNKNYSKSQKLRVILITTIAGIVVSLSWYGYTIVNYPDTREYIQENGINGTEQIKHMLSNPIEYVKVICKTLQVQGQNYLYTFVGSQLGWLNISTSMLTIIGFIILGVVSPFLSKREDSLNNKERLWILAIFVGIFILVLTGLYIGWTPVGGEQVEGIQGRYFIPIGILLLLCMCMKDKYIEFKYINVVYPVLLTLLNLSILKTVLMFFM